MRLNRTGMSDSNSNEEVDSNGIKMMKSITGQTTDTENQNEVIDQNEQEFQQVSRKKREDKNKHDKVSR